MGDSVTKTLHPFQQQASRGINRLLNSSRDPVLCMPTGTGKTFTACDIIKHRITMKERIFILTPQIEIFNQWLLELTLMKIDSGYINDKGVIGKNKQVYVCMPMSLNNLLPVLPEKFKPDLIITDECHHSSAATWTNIYTFFPDARKLGLTATPKRMDGQGLDSIYTDIIEPINMQEAIEQGFLSEPALIIPKQYIDEIPINNGEYDTQTQADQLGKPQIIGDIITQYGNIFAGLPVLCACSTHEHAKHMTDQFCNAGWNFKHIHSGLNYHERQSMLQGIVKGEINGLCTVGIGIEGLDIPGLHGLIWLRRTMSITIYLQFIGRVLRKAKGKKYGIIIDPVGNTFIHGRPELKRIWTLQGEGSGKPSDDLAPKMKICPLCNVMNAESNLYCHICNFDFSQIDNIEGLKNKRGFPAMVEGELVFLDADKMTDRLKDIQSAMQKNNKMSDRSDNSGSKKIKKLSQAEKMQLLKDGLSKKNNFFEKMREKYI